MLVVGVIAGTREDAKTRRHGPYIVIVSVVCAVLWFGAVLVAAPSAHAFVVGDDITSEPHVSQALDDARTYWGGRKPNCPTGITVTVADLSAASEAGGALDCALTIDLTWISAAPTRTQYCALFSHEYGHLLGYGHDDYEADRDKVMSAKGTPHYCRTFNVLTPTLPKACSWPAWARSTERIRSLYAAGRKHAAAVEFRKWRKKHPKAKLPRPCVLT